MFGRSRRQGEAARGPAPAKRHGRRAIRSAITGPDLPDPDGRVVRFELDARGALELLQEQLADELRGVRIGFATAPLPTRRPGAAQQRGRRGPRAGGDAPDWGDGLGESDQPLFYAIDRRARTIVLYRMPIQRARGLHIEDAEHRRLFTEHCVYRAVCEYLGRDPWDLFPGRFDHF